MATLNPDNDDPLAEALTSDQKRINEILVLLKKLDSTRRCNKTKKS